MFLFTHVEKCGGTSLHRLFSLSFIWYYHAPNIYGGNQIRNDLTITEFKKLRRYNFIGIGGHSVRPYYNYEQNTKKIVKYITFLRNPIDRSIYVAL